MCQPLVSKLFNCKGGLREGYTGGHLRANGFKTISANVILLVNKEGYCWRLFIICGRCSKGQWKEEIKNLYLMKGTKIIVPKKTLVFKWYFTWKCEIKKCFINKNDTSLFIKPHTSPQ